MNSAFENFVVAALRDAVGVSERAFPQGNRTLRLDRARVVTLEPDISWWDVGQCRFVGDVKYKHGVRGIKHPDVYQLLGYVVAADLPGGLLIYAAGEADEVSHEVVDVGRRLDVSTMDVSGSSDAILEQVRTVANRIKAMSLS